MLQLTQVISVLRRHKLAAILLAVEVALTGALLANAMCLLSERKALESLPTGYADETGVIALALSDLPQEGLADAVSRITTSMKAVPGVQAVSVTNASPYTSRAGESGFSLLPEIERATHQAHFYLVDPSFLKVSGVRVIAGRAFHSDEYEAADTFPPSASVALISESYAKAIWPDESPLGHTFYLNHLPVRIVGVTADVLRPDPSRWASTNTIFLPALPGQVMSNRYLLRISSEPDMALNAVRQAVRREMPSVTIDNDNTGMMSQLKVAYFASDEATGRVLTATALGMLAMTTVSVMGLSTLWVRHRRRQIGLRRALGATQASIVQLFLLENLVIAGTGAIAGVMLSYGISLLMMDEFATPLITPWHVGIAALVLIGVMQVAALWPALAASRLSPGAVIKGC
ncbi:ABC transporter permease [Luteibacter sahnii]|uniref:ABC transporter permease n=1 Tax=Luteibacter sahnii TaxID=3021977 RepID=UPI002A6A05E4|nr:FtsX-like permease family protein [Luteibacter sp. PPL193]MDY1549575.1 ABC transporter permease [Luteibacter sp. PPL193]